MTTFATPRDHTITAVKGQDTWEGAHGPMVTYTLELEGVSGLADLNQKPQTPPPSVAQVLFGHLEEGKFGKWRFKKDQRPDTPRSFNGGGNKQDKPWGRQPTPPEDAARMLRCHSQSVAVQAVEVAIGAGVEKPPGSIEEFLKLVRRTADFMDRDVLASVANAALSVDDAQRRSEEQL